MSSLRERGDGRESYRNFEARGNVEDSQKGKGEMEKGEAK